MSTSDSPRVVGTAPIGARTRLWTGLRYFLPITRKRRKTPQRYGWAELLPPDSPRLRRLSPDGHTGLKYLSELAENAAERRTLALSAEAPKRLTITEIAREDRISRARIYDLIRRARIELFGKDLSDSAIYARLRHERAHGLPAARPCAEPGCTRRLPIKATARRRYCNFHLAPHARVARHRKRQAGT